MGTTRCLTLALGAAVLAVTTALAAEPVTPPPADPALAHIRAMSAASQALTQKISGSLIRVRVEQHLDTLVPEKLRSAWEDFQKDPRAALDGSPTIVIEGSKGKGDAKASKDFRREFRPGGPGAGPGGPGGNRLEAFSRRRDPASTMPGKPGFINALLLERFFEARTRSPQPDVAAEAQAIIAKLHAVRTGASSEVYAAVYDSSHALLLTAVALPAEKNKLTAYFADGSEMSVKVLATDFRRGLTYLELESLKTIVPAALASGKPAAGEFLACVSASTGSVTMLSTPLPNPNRKKDERFPVAGFEDRAGFVFGADGGLVAIALERSAVPVALIRKEITAGEAGTILEPRPLGVRYDPVAPDSAERVEHKLGQRPAVRVTDVIPNSPAQWAGIQKGDYVITIDGRSVLQIREILRDLATKTTPVRIGLVRGEEQMERELPWEKPKE